MSEQRERIHHRLQAVGAGIGQRDIQHAGAHDIAAPADLLDHPVRTAAEADRQHAADIGLRPLAGDVARRIDRDQRVAQPAADREWRAGARRGRRLADVLDVAQDGRPPVFP